MLLGLLDAPTADGGSGTGRSTRGEDEAAGAMDPRMAAGIGYARCYLPYLTQHINSQSFVQHEAGVQRKIAEVQKVGSIVHPSDVVTLVLGGGEPVTQHALVGVKDDVKTVPVAKMLATDFR